MPPELLVSEEQVSVSNVLSLDEFLCKLRAATAFGNRDISHVAIGDHSGMMTPAEKELETVAIKSLSRLIQVEVVAEVEIWGSLPYRAISPRLHSLPTTTTSSHFLGNPTCEAVHLSFYTAWNTIHKINPLSAAYRKATLGKLH